MARIIDGKAVAAVIEAEASKVTRRVIEEYDVTPTLNLMVVEGDEGSERYVERKAKSCERIRAKGIVTKFKKEVGEHELLSSIEASNLDGEVHGILVQLPLPPEMDEITLTSAITLSKDVDGLNPAGLGRLLSGGEAYVAAGAEAAKILVEKSGVPVKGAHCIILGASNILGKPFAALMLREGAHVTVAQAISDEVKRLVKSADILLVDVAIPRFLRADMVKEGCVIVDAGANIVDGKVVGDVDSSTFEQVSSHLSPVPGGLGPVLIAVLLSHLADAALTQVSGRSKPRRIQRK